MANGPARAPEHPPAAEISDNPDVFLSQVELWEGPLYRHCHRMLGDAHDAEDLCQEALLRAYQNRHRYDPRYRFSTWLFTIATRLCLTEIRRRQVRPLFHAREPEAMPEVADAGTGPRGTAEAREAERLLVAALAQLPAKYRVPVSLHYEKAMSLVEIGEILGILPNLVKMRLFRGRERLLELLLPHVDEDGKGRTQ